MIFFDYFQIISLSIFFLIFLGRTVRLKQKGIRVMVIGSGKKGFAAFLEKCFVVLLPIWLLEIFIHSLRLDIQFLPAVLVRPLFVNQALQTLGAVAILVGILVFSLALVAFKSSWRIGIDMKAPGDLITTGIFSASRNPIFLSMHFQILQEEKFLIGRYGDSYRGYMRRVNRYI